MIYFNFTTSIPMFRGFDNICVRLIPVIMTLSGLSISLVLRYFDNIVKLMCSSVCVLVVNMVIASITGGKLFSPTFLFGWMLTIPATYLYNVAPSTEKDSTEVITSNSLSTKSQSLPVTVTEKKVFSRKIIGLVVLAVLVLCFVRYTLHEVDLVALANRKASTTSNRSTSITQDGNSSICNLVEIPMDGPSSNLHSIKSFTAQYGKQFVYVDHSTSKLYVDCPMSKVKVLGADIRALDGDKWRFVNYSSVDTVNQSSDTPGHFIPWSSVLRSDKEPYAWIMCDLYPDVNYIFRPPTPENKNKDRHSRPLSEIELNQVREYVSKFSVEVNKTVRGVKKASKILSALEDMDVSPVFDNVLVLYFDAVSHTKFKKFFNSSYTLLQSMGLSAISDESRSSSHVAVPLTQLHSLGLNSGWNYPPMMAGVTSAYGEMKDGFQSSQNKTRQRENWIFDLAEAAGYSTLAGMTGCANPQSKYDDLDENYDAWDVDGFRRFYMMDTSSRTPTEYFWPGSASCESLSRSELLGHTRSSKKGSEDVDLYYLANKFSASYLLDWVLTWMAAHHGVRESKSKPFLPTFGLVLLEEAHTSNSFFSNCDKILEQFLRTVFFSDERTSKLYGLDNFAMMLLSDHGMHYGKEYSDPWGKVANKRPFAYTIVPRAFLKANPSFRDNLEFNSNLLTSPYDVRAMIQYWLTGRDFSKQSKGTLVAASVSPTNSSLNPDVFASSHGNSLMNVKMNPHRSCDEAGIPSFFCGCNLVLSDCTEFVSSVRSHFKDIAELVNHYISLGGETAMEICQPVSESDFVILPDSGKKCYVVENKTSRLIDIDIKVIRNALAISVQFEIDKNGVFKVNSLNTVSRWGGKWDLCKQEFEAKKLPINLEGRHFQYCYCKSIDRYWMSVALKTLSWLQ